MKTENGEGEKGFHTAGTADTAGFPGGEGEIALAGWHIAGALANEFADAPPGVPTRGFAKGEPAPPGKQEAAPRL